MTAAARIRFMPKRFKVAWGATAARVSGLRLPREVSRAVTTFAGYGGFDADAVYDRLKTHLLNVDRTAFDRYVNAVHAAAGLCRVGAVDARTEALAKFVGRILATMVAPGNRPAVLAEIDRCLSDAGGVADAERVERPAGRNPIKRRLPGPVAWVVSVTTASCWFSSAELHGALGLDRWGLSARIVRTWGDKIRQGDADYRCHAPPVDSMDIAAKLAACLIATDGVGGARRALERISTIEPGGTEEGQS